MPSDNIILGALDAPAFRAVLMKNSYRPIRVHLGSKRPMANDWTAGESPEVLLSSPRQENTGLLTEGLRVVDLDIDDPRVAERVMAAISPYLPLSPAIRRRQGSHRVALLFRAEGEGLGKLAIKGPHGGIDILGKGSQLVVDGLHPSGSRYNWLRGRSPATVPYCDLPSISEAAISAILTAAAPILGAEYGGDVTSRGNCASSPNLNDELSAGIGVGGWFGSIPTDKMAGALEAALNAIDNTIEDPRERWLQIIFACAHAKELGCIEARPLALEWSERGKGWTSEADFDTAWESYKPGRGITVGALLHLAESAGCNFSPWRDRIGMGVLPISSGAPIDGGAILLSSLPLVPPKREWLHGTDAARGAVTLVVAPGGKGKSSWLTAMALAGASGRSLLGVHVFGGPLKVLYINAEDPTDEMNRKFRAAMIHLGLTNADVSGLMVVGAERWRASLLTVERGEAKLNAVGWATLAAAMDRAAPDIVIVDPLVAVAGGASLNDNAAAALLMSGLVHLAAERHCGIVLAHHAAKGRDIQSAEAAMGAASLVNLARIVLAVETLSEADAPKLGVMPWEARSVFRIIGTKQNLSPVNAGDRWYKLHSVELPNPSPPIYPSGDKIAVVEVFVPNPAGSPFPPAMIQAALTAISSAPVPLSLSANSKAHYVVPVVAAAIAPHRGGVASDGEAKALVDYLLRTGQIAQTTVSTPRAGHGASTRKGLTVASPQPATTTP